jgi:hypothetical protein
MKRKLNKEQTTWKYLQFLVQLRDELTNNSIKEPHYLMVKYGVSTRWLGFLVQNNVVYRDENDCCKWNKEIPVSEKLVEEFRKYRKEKNIKYKQQLKIKDMNVETHTKRRTWENKETTEKWLKNLFFIKNELDNTEYYKLMDLKSSLPNWKTWQAFLVKNNIIHKRHTGRYVWNDKIPITFKIIEAYRKEQHIRNYRQKTINKKLETQPELQFDMNYIEIPAEIKAKARAESKTRATKVKVQEPINIPTQQNEYGLIRKFLKLIWTFLKWLW